MLETSIIKTGKMDVMERSQVDKVLTELRWSRFIGQVEGRNNLIGILLRKRDERIFVLVHCCSAADDNMALMV